MKRPLALSTGDWLGIQPGEWPKTAGMFAYLMLAVGTFITGRVTRDSLFLSRYDITYLPTMYAWVAATMIVLSYSYSRFADRFRRDYLVQWTTIGLLIGTLGARIMLSMVGDWFYPVLYVYIEVMGGLLTIQFWTFANDVFDTREAKRLFSVVNAGGVMATVLAGLSIHSLAASIGTANLLFLCAGLLLGCLVLVNWLSRTCRRELTLAVSQNTGPAIALASDWKRVFSSRHLRLIAWITLAIFATVTIVDYQFKIIARGAFLNQEDQLSRFFGGFYGAVGVLSIFIQFFVTSRLLKSVGIVISLLLLPVALGLGSVLLMAFPCLWVVTLLKGSDNTLRYTVHEPASQILYIPVPGRLRGRAKAFIEGILKPAAQGATGLILVLTSGLVGVRIEWLSWVVLCLLLGWVLVVLGLKQEYVQSLVATLRQRRIHLGDTGLDPSTSQTVKALEETLGDADDQNVVHALQMLPWVRRHDWSNTLQRLLEHRSPKVRLHALRLLANEDSKLDIGRVLTLFLDPDEKVRAEAVRLYCKALRGKAMGAVEPLLSDDSVRVKSSALEGLIRYGGLDGVVTAAETLKAMLRSRQAVSRRNAAWVIGQVGVKTFYHSLLPLLDDPEVEVRQEAIRAAGKLKCKELVLPLLQALADSKCARSAIRALANYGADLVVTLRTVLDNPVETDRIRRNVPPILARIGTQLSMDVLCNALDAQHTGLRSAILNGIVRLRQHHPHLRPDKEMLRRVLSRELKSAYQVMATLEDLSRLDHPLLIEALTHRYTAFMDRMFQLLRVLHPGRHMETALNNLDNPRTALRANALELLEQTLDGETRKCLLPLLENRNRAELIHPDQSPYPLLRRSESDWLHELLLGPHAWTTACALDFIRQAKDKRFQSTVELLLRHDDPTVRETAVFCLQALSSSPSLFMEAIHPLHDDPHPVVRSTVRRLALTGQSV